MRDRLQGIVYFIEKRHDISKESYVNETFFMRRILEGIFFQKKTSACEHVFVCVRACVRFFAYTNSMCIHKLAPA